MSYLRIPTRGVGHLSPCPIRVLAALTSGLITLSTILPLSAQDHSLKDTLSGRIHPLSVPLKEFNSTWRRITIQTRIQVSDNLSLNISGNSSGATSQNNVVGALAGSRQYLTQGTTVEAGGRTYIVAYHLPNHGMDVGLLLRSLATKTVPSTSSLTSETPLPLSLLDLQTIGSIDDIRVFDLEAELQESDKASQLVADLFRSQSGAKPTNGPAAKSPEPEN